jgi:hypothetical protein
MIGQCATCGQETQLVRGVCHRDYRRARSAGAITSRLVDATPAKAKIAELLDAGWSTSSIARVAGISRGAVFRIMRGRAAINQKTLDALRGLDAETKPVVRKPVETRHRHRRAAVKNVQTLWPANVLGVENVQTRWAAELLGVTVEQLVAERKRERRQSFPEVYQELRSHVGLSDWQIAKRLSITNDSLLRMCQRHGIRPTPEFISACARTRTTSRRS